MAAKKKAATKKKAAAPVVERVFYRGCDHPYRLYRVDATEVVEAPGGGLDLTEVPPGKVFAWDPADESWEPVKSLPCVGKGPGCVRHTKNAAKIGV